MKLFFGANNAAIAYTVYGSPSNIIPAFNINSTTSTSNDTINQGTHRIGREQTHSGGNSLSTIRIALPKLTKCNFVSSRTAGGFHTADFGAHMGPARPQQATPRSHLFKKPFKRTGKNDNLKNGLGKKALTKRIGIPLKQGHHEGQDSL